MNAYGCVKCQQHHCERDALYTLHLMFQSKHGIYRVSGKDWAFGKLVASRNTRRGASDES